jgi:lipopolysaccharide/colanic/teichoic acid biosynthesis glycosyltransferase
VENEEILLASSDGVDVVDTATTPQRRDIVNHIYKKYLKRVFDVSAVSVGLIILAVPMIVVAIIVKTTSKGPVLLRQKRIGKDGEYFTLYKFRSMVDNAEDVLEELMAKDPEIKREYLANKKLHDDPRITKIGKFIRCTSIDELPQLLNVFKGDMSLIGPRPYMLREREKTSSLISTTSRLSVRVSPVCGKQMAVAKRRFRKGLNTTNTISTIVESNWIRKSSSILFM